jgi:hypothetical protein
MTDDDLLMPGAIRKVLSELEKSFALLVASVEVRNKDLTKVLTPRRPELLQDQIFQPANWNEFASKVGRHLTFVGVVIIDRELWLSRNREKYFGTGFVHVGAIFDEPIVKEVLVIAAPLVTIRFGNAQWSNRAFQIWMFGWPELIWSFTTISGETKQEITLQEPWRDLKTLLLERTFGTYSLREYQLFLEERLPSKSGRALAKIVAMFPQTILLLLAFLYAWVRPSNSDMMIFNLKDSWHHKNR